MNRANQRIKRKSGENIDGLETHGKGKNDGQQYDSSKYSPKKIGRREVDTGILNTDGNIAKIKSNNYSASRYSGDDDAFTNDVETYNNIVLPPRSCTRASSAKPLFMGEKNVKSLPRKSKANPSQLFNSSIPRSRNEEKLYALESDHIHERIKNLMRKNNSVLVSIY